MKISEYPVITSIDSSNVMLVDGDAGTKQMLMTDAFLAMMHAISPMNHRMIFRGKNLGTSLTTAQRTAIQNGTFEDLWLGDYWVINDRIYRIADFDYWYRRGDTIFANHHLVVIPDVYLYTHAMNTEALSTGAYVGSEMYTTGLADAKSIVTAAFGDALLTHRELLADATSGNYSNSSNWYDSTVDLPNEIMIYGCHVVTTPTPTAKRDTLCKLQLALFSHCPTYVDNRNAYWLRDVGSSTAFAYVDWNGCAALGNADNKFGVRPVFAIG